MPFILAVAAMYPSPYVALFNYQNTRQLYSSIDWAAVTLPQNATILANSYVGRYAVYKILAGDGRYMKLYSPLNTLPKSFSQLALLSGNQTYMLIDKETTIVAAFDLRAWSFPSPHDVAAIQKMEGVSTLYDNGETQILLVQPVGGPGAVSGP
jgi:hypothetical protein